MAQDSNKRVLLYHIHKEDKTIEDFVNRQKIIGVTADEVFDDNRDYIYEQMSVLDKEVYKNEKGTVPTSGADLDSGMTLPFPCKIKVCPYNITAETAVNNTNWHTPNNDFYAFAYDEIQKIFESPAYSLVVDKRNCDVEVIGWFKQAHVFNLRGEELKKSPVLNSMNSSFIKGAWMDLSKFVISMNSSCGQNGGSFVIRFPIIGFAPKLTAYHYDFFGRSLANLPLASFFEWGREYYSKKPLKTAQLNNLFSALISYNDLIFLSFVRGEGSEKSKNIDEYVAENNWDLIGIVDDVRVNLNGSSGSGYVEVTGRDLMKLLIEDGSYFFNPSVAYSADSVFANEVQNNPNGGSLYKKGGDVMDVTSLGVSDDEHGLKQRLRNISQEIDIFAYKPMREISYILKGVVSQLSNIEVVPGECFDSWSNRTLWKDLSIE